MNQYVKYLTMCLAVTKCWVMLEIVVIIIKSGSDLKQDKFPLRSDGDPCRQKA